MKVLGLDLSSKAGWAVLEASDSQAPSLRESGVLELGTPILGFGTYPWAYVKAATKMAAMIVEKVVEIDPDVIVIEETNLGKNRYSQKFLEFLHLAILQLLPEEKRVWTFYISSSAWRKTLELSMSTEDRRNNTKLSKAKKHAFVTGSKLNKKSLGIKGKINKKHLAVRFVNARYNLNFKMKDNDRADAICLATAYLAGADICDGQ